MAVNQNINKKVDNRINFRRLLDPGPHTCRLCAAALDRPCEFLCPACITDLPLNQDACPVCALPDTYGFQCVSCLRSVRPYSRVLACYKYEYPVSRLIQAIKFRSRLDLARFLGQQMAIHFNAITEKPDCLIPVPLHPRRLAARGFNQSLEIANSISAMINIPVSYKNIRRAVATLPQTELDAKQRKLNVRGAFELARTIATGKRHVAIVDDVVTTGATVMALAKLLRDKGVARVDIWAGARAVL